MDHQDTAALARTIASAALEKLAADVRIVDLRGVVSYTDWFVIVTGASTRQTRAIADHVVDELRDEGLGRPRRQDTDPDGSWLLLDYVDVVLHVFTPESREFYRLEALWGQVPQHEVTEESDLAAIGGDGAGSDRARA